MKIIHGHGAWIAVLLLVSCSNPDSPPESREDVTLIPKKEKVLKVKKRSKEEAIEIARNAYVEYNTSETTNRSNSKVEIPEITEVKVIRSELTRSNSVDSLMEAILWIH